MSGVKVPCYHCENRTVGCHGKCESYLDFKAERAAIKRKRSAHYEEETDYMNARRWNGYGK